MGSYLAYTEAHGSLFNGKTYPRIIGSVGNRLSWLGHVERMADDNTIKKIKRWKPMSKSPIGRPKTLWEDDVLEDIKA
jgi:hypothetical protein